MKVTEENASTVVCHKTMETVVIKSNASVMTTFCQGKKCMAFVELNERNTRGEMLFGCGLIYQQSVNIDRRHDNTSRSIHGTPFDGCPQIFGQPFHRDHNSGRTVCHDDQNRNPNHPYHPHYQRGTDPSRGHGEQRIECRGPYGPNCRYCQRSPRQIRDGVNNLGIGPLPPNGFTNW